MIKIDRLNRFDQSLLPKNIYVKTFLVAPIVPINLATWYLIYLCCDFLLDSQLNHIGVCIWVSILFPPSCAIVRPPFLHKSPVKTKYCLFRSIQTKSLNSGFVLSTSIVKNPLISPRFCNSMVDRYAIINFRVAILIKPMKQGSCFHNSLEAGNAYLYRSFQNQERTCTLIEIQ